MDPDRCDVDSQELDVTHTLEESSMVRPPGPPNADLLGLIATQNNIVILAPDGVGHPVCCLSHHCPSSPNSTRV